MSDVPSWSNCLLIPSQVGRFDDFPVPVFNYARAHVFNKHLGDPVGFAPLIETNVEISFMPVGTVRWTPIFDYADLAARPGAIACTAAELAAELDGKYPERVIGVMTTMRWRDYQKSACDSPRASGVYDCRVFEVDVLPYPTLTTAEAANETVVAARALAHGRVLVSRFMYPRSTNTDIVTDCRYNSVFVCVAYRAGAAEKRRKAYERNYAKRANKRGDAQRRNAALAAFSQAATKFETAAWALLTKAYPPRSLVIETITKQYESRLISAPQNAAMVAAYPCIDGEADRDLELDAQRSYGAIVDALAWLALCAAATRRKKKLRDVPEFGALLGAYQALEESDRPTAPAPTSAMDRFLHAQIALLS